jgi:hypothetical protein
MWLIVPYFVILLKCTTIVLVKAWSKMGGLSREENYDMCTRLSSLRFQVLFSVVHPTMKLEPISHVKGLLTLLKVFSLSQNVDRVVRAEGL